MTERPILHSPVSHQNRLVNLCDGEPYDTVSMISAATPRCEDCLLAGRLLDLADNLQSPR